MSRYATWLWHTPEGDWSYGIRYRDGEPIRGGFEATKRAALRGLRSLADEFGAGPVGADGRLLSHDVAEVQ